MGGHEGYDDLVVLNAFADEEMPPLDVLHLRMVLRVVRRGDRGLAVAVKLCWLIVAETQVVDDGRKGDRLASSLRSCHNLGLARGQGDARLLL